MATPAVTTRAGARSGGTAEELNPGYGAVEQQIAVGGDASFIHSADGDPWVLDDTNGVITRLHPGRLGTGDFTTARAIPS